MATPAPTRWNHTPARPLEPAPFLRLPWRPGEIGRHVLTTWRPTTVRVLMLIVAVAVWRWFSPTAAEAADWSFGWVGAIWARNVALVALAAGLPHLWLYVWGRQGEADRYDARPLGRDKRRFLFSDQVRDNMFLSLVPAPLIGSLWESLGWWAFANDVGIGGAELRSNAIWFVAMALLLPLWSIWYFSATHWLLHRGPLYTHIHAVHHKNVNVGPWSGLAMHPGEHAVLYGDVLLFLLLPVHPVLFLFAMMHHTLGAPLSHTGHEAIRLPGGAALRVGDFHHQLHHRFIECNYGGVESPLDDWIDAWHDGTPDGDRRIADRRRALNIARRA